VKAVEAGTVEIAGQLEGYGPSVVVGHGGGFYTLYLRLRGIAVKVGQTVAAGQVVGSVGGGATPEGPHLEFQVRTPSASGAPTPVDPLNWLRARAGAR
jgi:murein DD-endopeptidase MepM/ murein hydrolase activator NlpD